MGIAMLDRVKDYLMPIDEDCESYDASDADCSEINEQKPKLRLQKGQSAEMTVFVGYPRVFDDVQSFVDNLKASSCVIVNYAGLNAELRKRISDFLNGACYIMGGIVNSISPEVYIYTVKDFPVDKKSYFTPPISDKYFSRKIQ